MNRKSFVLYTEWEDTTVDITDELIKMIFDYAHMGTVAKSDNSIVDTMFSILRPAIDRNITKCGYDSNLMMQSGRVSGANNLGGIIDSVPLLSGRNEKGNPTGTKFDAQFMKQQLLSDESWKESACMQSTLGLSFMSMLPGQIDKFIAYIISIGEEQTISNLSDAKRRFTYWWQNHGRKEVQNENKQEYIIPD